MGASGPIERLLALSEHTDVYVGVAPRLRRAGGRDALGSCRLLWADCDSEAALAALADVPAPTMLVGSGSGSNCHAYWSVGAALSPEEVGEANRRLAAALGSDAGAVCGPAAILRPAGSRESQALAAHAGAAARIRARPLLPVCGAARKVA